MTPEPRWRPSPNRDARPPGVPIDMLVLHYTGMRSARAALDRLCDPAAGVSSHYLVEEDGLVWQMVAEADRARHAGVSWWRGHAGLNDRSIGIEIVNPGHEHGYRDFPALQMAAVCEVCLAVLARHPIPARNVVAHSDVAPDRKEDPGERFDWAGLAANGVGLWPAPATGPRGAARGMLTDAAERAALGAALARIGYRVHAAQPEAAVLRAFQRHWRQEAVTGEADAGTLARALAVARMCGD